MKVHYGTYRIPHLGFTVKVRRFKRAHPRLPGAVAYYEVTGTYEATLWLKPNETPGTVAHEVTHCLQYIAERYHMRFHDELEHFAYLMQYLVGSILGYRYDANRMGKTKAPPVRAR